jgi:hypothetical protein
MQRRDYTDIVGGGLLVGVGLFVALYSHEYSLGTLTRMGPAYFPRVLGYALAGLGVLIILPALVRRGERHPLQPRAFFAVLAAVLAFALTLRAFGMVPATVLLVAIAALAQHEVRLVPTLLLAAALATIAVAVFGWGLGVVVPAFDWPF